MEKQQSTRPRRGQTRVSFDEQMGDLWNWYSKIPERARAREVYHLVVVGFATMQGLARGAAVNAAGGGSVNAHAVPVSTAESDRADAERSAGHAKQETRNALNSWGGLNANAGFDTLDVESAA
jgi:hypothetical protein